MERDNEEVFESTVIKAERDAGKDINDETPSMETTREEEINDPTTSMETDKENEINNHTTNSRIENICDKKKYINPFEKVFGFSIEDVTSWNGIVKLLHRPSDPSSLAVARILFGFLMMVDVLEERGFGEADLKWGEPTDCRFPLFDFLEPLFLHWMCILYAIMWISACGIMLGWNYKLSCLMFAVPYWYMFLLDKTSWNNHSYMFGILAILFMVTDSHSLWSIDSWRGKITSNSHVPLWNYAILRFQLFLLYFYAGLKKTEYDWLNGYSMSSLSNHWVFQPMKYIFNLEQIDLWVIHVFGFIIDLTMGFLIYFDKTRAISFYVLTSFHLMNSQMFHIGMFPFVCLATMPLFCGFDWPRHIFLMQSDHFKFLFDKEPVRSPKCHYPEDDKDGTSLPTKRQCFSVAMLYIHVVLQLFLPYSHFISQGYNNWTNGLYGYSWDMMVHTWDTSRVTVKVINRDTNETMFIDPEAWVQNSRWQRHADMVVQYSKCVKKNLKELKNINNISIYIDIWVSLNKRFHQRMFDPRVDILTAEWSPFKPVSWVMPLMDELTSIREEIREIEKEVFTWSNYSDVLFMADAPGFTLENYVHKDLDNITLTLFKGELSVVVSNKTTQLPPGGSMKIPSATFHHLHTISTSPSAFMYTFYNKTKAKEPADGQEQRSQLSIVEIMIYKLDNLSNAIGLLSHAVLRILHSTPMIRRVKVEETDALYL